MSESENGMTEFIKGDRVKYSSLAHEKLGGKHKTGIVVSNTHEKYPYVRVLHDGLKHPYSYSKSFWVKDDK